VRRRPRRRPHRRPDGARRGGATGSEDGEAQPAEEYWLRVEASRYPAASSILGFEASEPAGDGEHAASSIGRFAPKVLRPASAGQVAQERERDETIRCSECGSKVAADEPFCPSCGLRFED
jgi:hypothetical protein